MGDFDNLHDAAIRIACWPPENEHRYASSARVPWHMIKELRAALDSIGYDWRKRRADERIDERRASLDWRLPEERQ